MSPWNNLPFGERLGKVDMSVWVFAIAIAMIGQFVFGYFNTGGLCYYGPNAGLYGELIQFIPRYAISDPLPVDPLLALPLAKPAAHMNAGRSSCSAYLSCIFDYTYSSVARTEYEPPLAIPTTTICTLTRTIRHPCLAGRAGQSPLSGADERARRLSRPRLLLPLGQGCM